MPIVDITLFEGRTPEQKRALQKAVSKAVETSIQSPPSTIRVILREVPKGNFIVATMFEDDQD